MANLEEDIKKIEKDVAESNYKRFYYFYGTENFLKMFYKNQIVDNALLGCEKEMNLNVITKDTYNEETISDIICAIPFFAQKRVVVFDEVNVFNKPELMNVFKNIPEETIVIVLEESDKKKSKKKNDDSEIDESNDIDGEENLNESSNLSKNEEFSLKKLKDDKNIKDSVLIVDFSKIADTIIDDNIMSIAKKNNIKIGVNERKYLAAKVGNDLINLESEIEKLSSYVLDKKEIKKEDIDKLCISSLEDSIFELVKDLTLKNSQGAIKKYKSLIAAGNQPQAILPLIAWQYMTIYECRIALDQNKNNIQIANTLGANQYVIDKSIAIAKKYKKEVLKEIVVNCNEISKELKKGENNLEFLIYKILTL